MLCVQRWAYPTLSESVECVIAQTVPMRYPDDFFDGLYSLSCGWRTSLGTRVRTYLRKRWPGIRLHRIQGYNGYVFTLPGSRIIKFTCLDHEIRMARLVQRTRPRGVVRVLGVGKYWYMMERCVIAPQGKIPNCPGFDLSAHPADNLPHRSD
jgi:hypothetical protein